MLPFADATRRWFERSFSGPTRVQAEGWERIARGRHSLLIAPTGSGKTLAAFLACIDRLSQLEADAAEGVRVVYVSPLKALAHDIERNLQAPLEGIAGVAAERGETLRLPRVALRTGDTSQRDRRAQTRRPAEILVTTPESLYLILGSQQRETLASVETVIVDEIHALAPSKRGAHLALSLERLAALSRAGDPQRIGLSATARPADRIASFLGGDRAVEIVDTSEPPRIDLRISVPVDDMNRPQATSRTEESGGEPLGLWPAIFPKLLEAIRAHTSTLVFVNSRGLCERLAHDLNELAGEPIVRAHHGSVAQEKRRDIEAALKAGTLRGIVATSSLELGIDMGAIDLVLLVESPGEVARGLQRLGRAGHQVGEVSRGVVFPKHPGDLLEATVLARAMRRGEVEPLRIPENPLDVLAQQIVAMASVEPLRVSELEQRIARAAPYRTLSRAQLSGVLDMLAGRFPSTDMSELRPRILWDREHDRIEGRPDAKRLALISGGTIPDRGLYPVHLGEGGPRVGELDEEMVNETRPGEIVTLGASSWRVTEITRDRVLVTPAPGEAGKLPFWRGDGPGRPIELGRELGAFVRELGARIEREPAAAREWLGHEYGLDRHAVTNLLRYVDAQREATGTLPTDTAITLERFRDELGDWRVCLLSPFGARVHAPWALAIEARLARHLPYALQTLWSDDGIMLRLADSEEPPPLDLLVPEPAEVEELLMEVLGRSSLFATQFRENAARALLLPRRRPGTRTPLWTQRLRAQSLQAVAAQHPSFPILLETYRSCLRDVFDLDALVDLLERVQLGSVRVERVETASASPFARSLVFAYTAAYLYQGDVPSAERRAQALQLDRRMLRDLLGQDELRKLLDPQEIEGLEAELQGRAEALRARHADALHDALRRVGDLAPHELAERVHGDAAPLVERLEETGRAVWLPLAGERRLVASEDAALYRDALGAALPDGLPEALLAPVTRPLEQLVRRYARTHGPFVTQSLAHRYAVAPGLLEPALEGLERSERLERGEFHPRGGELEWCDPDVLRRLRRRTLARLRASVRPVPGAALARFLLRWQGIGSKRDDRIRLDEALDQLEGLPLPFRELESRILPARVRGFEPRLLDERGALGHLVWVGHGAIGDTDGRVALYRRERIALLADPPERPDDLSPLEGELLEALASGGATFFGELANAHPEVNEEGLLTALWRLVWAGLVTNDTFVPLRARAATRSTRRSKSRHVRARSAAASMSGRWSLVEQLLRGRPEPTAVAHARAHLLLERYGVVSREALQGEPMHGGFAAVYPLLRAMEESGKLRRGHFVADFTGAQFAFARTVDALRETASGSASTESPPVLLAATDPANPYGALLPWPDAKGRERSARRAAGASVVLLDGELALFAERGGRAIHTFGDIARLVPALRALRPLTSSRLAGPLRVERIDGDPARGSRLKPAFLQAGFRDAYNALELDAFEASG